MLKLVQAETAEHIDEVRKLFAEYSESRPGDPALHDFAAEIATLPGKYGAPNGCLILAYHKSQTAGCVGLRVWGDNVAEMKRLYVRPQLRGLGIGRALAEELIRQARCLGYHHIRLDTIPGTDKAQSLYRALGFIEIAPYRCNPNPGTLFFDLPL